MAAENVAQDLDMVMRHLKDEFGGGQSSVSGDDILANGQTLAETVSDILDTVSSAGHTGLDPDELEALRCMNDTWGGGFDLVNTDDFFDNDRTLGELAEAYVPQAFAIRSKN